MGRRYRDYFGSILLFSVGAALCYGQNSQNIPNSFASEGAPASSTLTLAQAESLAVANQPRLLAAQLRTRAAAQRVREARSGLFPTIAFNATGVAVADTGTSTAAGALTTSSISDRFSYGGNLVQLVTDFGRTSALVGAQRSLADAQKAMTTLTAAQIRLSVRSAYFQVIGAEAVLHAAREAQGNRQLIFRQVSALAGSQLRSTLDVSFASVLESEAELAVVSAESAVQQQRTRLATAMGQLQPVTATLVAEQLPSQLPLDPSSFLAQADLQRADLNAAISQQHAAS